MYINILSFNVFQYNGFGNGYKKVDTQDKIRTHNNLFKKIFEIININNINIVFLQEDDESLNESTEKKFNNIDFVQVKFYKSNSIYIKNSLKSKVNDILCNDIEKDNSFIAVKLNLYDKKNIVIVNTQLYGGILPENQFISEIKENNIEVCDMISNIRNQQVTSIFNETFYKFGIYPTIFGGDFNSVHPDYFDPNNINQELKDFFHETPRNQSLHIDDGPQVPQILIRQYSDSDHYKKLKLIQLTDKQYLIKKFITRCHNLLNSFRLKTILINKPTNIYGTTTEFLYYDEMLLNYISSDIIELLPIYGISNHNPIIYSYKIKLEDYTDFFEEHHNAYKDDYLYSLVINKIDTNLTFLKDHMKIDLKDKKEIYNFFLLNYLNKDIKNILDNLFEKIKINKNQLFINGFNPPSFKNILLENKDFSGISHKDILDNLKKNLFIEHIKELNNKNIISDQEINCLGINNTDKKSKFKEIFGFFNNKKRDQGALYTTSNFDNDKNVYNNMKLSLSSQYFGNKYNQTNMLKIVLPLENMDLYDLSGFNFKRRTLFRMILTNILTNGRYDYNLDYKEVKKLTDDSKIEFNKQILVKYPTQCVELLENDLYKKTTNDNYEKIDTNQLCITGFWDGDKNFDEKINNHFMNIYNSYNIYNKQIVGYVSFDSNFDQTNKKTIYNREIVWFSQQLHLTNHAMFFKNHIIYNNTTLYGTIYKFCKNNLDKIINDNTIEFTDESNKILSNSLQQFILKIPEIIENPNIILPDYKNFISNKITDNKKFNKNIDDFYDRSNDNSSIIKSINTSMKDYKSASLRGGDVDYHLKYLKYKKLYIELK